MWQKCFDGTNPVWSSKKRFNHSLSFVVVLIGKFLKCAFDLFGACVLIGWCTNRIRTISFYAKSNQKRFSSGALLQFIFRTDIPTDVSSQCQSYIFLTEMNSSCHQKPFPRVRDRKPAWFDRYFLPDTQLIYTSKDSSRMWIVWWSQVQCFKPRS